MVQELKPFVDSKYRTKADQPNTFVFGSSMGALISCYALCEYPDIFSGAGCLSTHWSCSSGIMVRYLDQPKVIPDAGRHKFYFDLGTDQTDEDYYDHQIEVVKLFEQRNYGKSLAFEFFQGDDHSELCWKNRLHVPLLFFLGKQFP